MEFVQLTFLVESPGVYPPIQARRGKTIWIMIVSIHKHLAGKPAEKAISPALQAGLLMGDILAAVVGNPVGDPDEIMVQLARGVVRTRPGANLTRRSTGTLTVTIGVRK